MTNKKRYYFRWQLKNFLFFILLLFALTNIYTRDIEVSSRQLTARKIM
uniref:Uncharacterized protein n=1 Tax=Arundo donax TaxID=35708 RepID=A0A0A9FV36_ARUDO